MDPILKNILAVIAGLCIGFMVNGAIISISGSVIPLPEGVDPNDMASLEANIHLFEPKHFIFPFLAHALGTLTAAMVAAFMAASHPIHIGLVIGVIFMILGLMMVIWIPAPTWFNILDLSMAYLPMGYLGARLFSKKE